MTIESKQTEELADISAGETPKGNMSNPGDKPRKSPTYKLSPEELTKQVIALNPKDMDNIAEAIIKEKNRRKEELKAKLEELGYDVP